MAASSCGQQQQTEWYIGSKQGYTGDIKERHKCEWGHTHKQQSSVEEYYKWAFHTPLLLTSNHQLGDRYQVLHRNPNVG